MKEWKTPEYTRTGWIGFGLFLLVVGVDIFFACMKWPTLSNYVSRRAEDQPLFGAIVLGILIWLAWHWLERFFKKYIRRK